jgi:hypothetical protein
MSCMPFSFGCGRSSMEPSRLIQRVKMNMEKDANEIRRLSTPEQVERLEKFLENPVRLVRGYQYLEGQEKVALRKAIISSKTGAEQVQRSIYAMQEKYRTNLRGEFSTREQVENLGALAGHLRSDLDRLARQGRRTSLPLQRIEEGPPQVGPHKKVGPPPRYSH